MKKRPDSEPSAVKYPFDQQQTRRRIWLIALAISELLVFSLMRERQDELKYELNSDKREKKSGINNREKK